MVNPMELLLYLIMFKAGKYGHGLEWAKMSIIGSQPMEHIYQLGKMELLALLRNQNNGSFGKKLRRMVKFIGNHIMETISALA